MSHLDDDTLVAIVLGEPPSADDRRHLDGCARCRTEADDLARTARAVRDSSGVGPLVDPGPDTWAAIEARLDDEDRADQDAAPDVAGVPRLRSVPTDDGGAQPGRRRAARRRVSTVWVAAAAVIGLVAGALGGVLGAGVVGPRAEQAGPARPSSSTSSAPARTLAAVGLATPDDLSPRGDAALVRTGSGTELQVTARDLEPDGGYLEVWLINRDLDRMVSLGVLPADSAEHTFPVSPALVEQGYVIVDVSREAFDDQPAHSGDTLVQGTLDV